MKNHKSKSLVLSAPCGHGLSSTQDTVSESPGLPLCMESTPSAKKIWSLRPRYVREGGGYPGKIYMHSAYAQRRTLPSPGLGLIPGSEEVSATPTPLILFFR